MSRDTAAYYDVEDMDDEETSSAERDTLTTMTTTTGMDRTYASTVSQSILNRQRAISSKYMKADPGRSLDVTGMYVFHDKSSMMTPMETEPYRKR